MTVPDNTPNAFPQPSDDSLKHPTLASCARAPQLLAIVVIAVFLFDANVPYTRNSLCGNEARPQSHPKLEEFPGNIQRALLINEFVAAVSLGKIQIFSEIKKSLKNCFWIIYDI